MPNLNFWHNRNVLVTGATGFIGGTLTETLMSLGTSVSCIVRSPAQKLLSTHKSQLYNSDINDFEALRKIIAKSRPQVVFHLAGEAIQAQEKNYATNVAGTRNILEALRLESTETHLIFASTTAVYGAGTPDPFIESTPPTPATPYASSKLMAEKIIGEYGEKFNISSVIARISNVYGGRDMNYSHLIPGQARNILLQKRPVIHSDGRSVCDFIYIDDIIEGLTRLGELAFSTKGQSEVFNLSTGKSTSVLDAVNMMLDITSNQLLQPILNQSVFTTNTLMRTSPGKMLARLNWQAETDLRDGLEKTVAWYQHHLV